MTHTLHRMGDAEDLANDFPMLSIRAVGYNDEGSDEKLQEFLRIARRFNPVNLGAITLGNMYSHDIEEVIAAGRGVVHAVFDNPGDVVACAKALKEADLGMSVVVSGILDEVNRCCKEAGIKRHTVEFSLGVWGNTGVLPPRNVLELSTMCGHGMVSSNLVVEMVDQIRNGKRSAEDAARHLAAQCCCGVFNPTRGAQLLAKMASTLPDD